MAQPEGFSRDDVVEGKMYAVLAYLAVLCIIPLILKRRNPFVLFHGKQGLVLFIAEAATVIVSVILPGVFTPFMFVLSALSFWGMVDALRGTAIDIPVVAGIARTIDL